MTSQDVGLEFSGLLIPLVICQLRLQSAAGTLALSAQQCKSETALVGLLVLGIFDAYHLSF